MVKQMWVGQALAIFWFNLRTNHRIGRVTSVIIFWVGFIFGLVWPVDYKTKHFKPNHSYRLKVLNKLNSLFVVEK
jgi:hypothetical protein